MMEGRIKMNPVRLVPRLKEESHLPVFYKEEAMNRYFGMTTLSELSEYRDAIIAEPSTSSSGVMYKKMLSRLIVSLLYCLGLRRSELISLCISDVDFGRNVVRVHGKGNKMREIPIIGTICEEILLYLKAVEVLVACKRSLKEPLLLTYTGKRLYPGYVDKVVKKELSSVSGITGRKSPHVLRHTLATQLLDNEADLNSIKELLGHSSLAATQVYTHNSVAKLKFIYKSAHPRAKNGGKHGD
jgi:integrase/recombinase XerC